MIFFFAVSGATNFALDTGRRGKYDSGKRLSEHAVGFTSIVYIYIYIYIYICVFEKPMSRLNLIFYVILI
jgi:hypothetical protein